MRVLALFLALIVSAQTFAKAAKYNCNDYAFAKSKLNIAALNFVNAKTTKAHDGRFYRRKLLNGCFKGICNIIETTSHKNVYDPSHPDADQTGNVKYPAINPKHEYFAVSSAIRALKELASKNVCNTRLTFQDKDLIVIQFNDHSSNYFKFLEGRVISWTATNSNGGNTVQFLN